MTTMRALRAAVVGSTAVALLISGFSAAHADQQLPADQLPPALVEAIGRDLKITPAEYLRRAAKAQELASYARDFRSARPHSFAGAWLGIDGKPVIAVTSADAARIATRDGYETRIAPVSADGLEQSLAELNRWIARLPREVSQQVNGTSIDFLDNKIVIDIVNSPAGRFLNLPTLLAQIKVIVSPGGGGPIDNKPMGGDTYITSAKSLADSRLTEIGVCSFGFNGVDGAGQAYNISAGHCDPNHVDGGVNTKSAAVYVPDPANLDASPQVGDFQHSTLGVATDGLDYALIKLNARAVKAGMDRPIVRGANGTTLTITGTAAPVTGAPVCKTGQSSTFTCGIVAADRVETQLYTEDGRSRVVRGFASTACTLAGDSGGAIVTGTLALGITSGSNSSDAPNCQDANIALAPDGGTASLGIPIRDIVDHIQKSAGSGPGAGIRVRTS